MSNGTEIIPNSTYILFFFLMVVVCLAGWCMGMQTMLLIDGVKKRGKDHKRYLYKFGKNERSTKR